MVTIVYGNGGDRYFGEYPDKPLKFWKKFGKEHNFKYLYKGYHYYDGKKKSVVVFDNKKWSREEIERRKNNGFLGIRVYRLDVEWD